jgi:hypothetical protein
MPEWAVNTAVAAAPRKERRVSGVVIGRMFFRSFPGGKSSNRPG